MRVLSTTMNKKPKKRLNPGVTISVSQRAHRKMRAQADKAMPRRTLRQQINFMNNLPIKE